MNWKKILLAATLLFATGYVKAATTVNSAVIVNEAGVAYDNTFTLDMNATEASRIALQANYSSATIPAVTFTDGAQSTGQVTVVSTTNVLSAPATNQITVTATNNIAEVAATNLITILSTTSISGKDVTISDGKRTIIMREGREWLKSTTSSGTAAALATYMNKLGFVIAGNTTGQTTVYSTATLAGTAPNSYTLTSNTTNITVLTPTYTGGAFNAFQNAFLNLNGKTLRSGYEWVYAPTSSGTATNIAAAISTVSGFSASASGSVVYATATIPGAAGNSFTLSASTVALSVNSATFTGGRGAATLTVGGIPLTFGVDIATAATTTLMATNIKNAINANPSISAAITASSALGVVFATSNVTGAGTNYTLAASPASVLTVSGATLTGGTDTAINLLTEVLTKTAHGLTLGLPVLFTKTAGTVPTPLVVGTTYYARPLTADTFQLATTSTGAVAGMVINMSSFTALGGGSFTLTPLAITGTPSFKWQWSNDATNWSDMSISSVTVASPYTAGSTVWDVGNFNLRWLRLKVVAPTAGGLSLKVYMNGKND